jgi:PadR family transcriptional regulator, regulatory protein PadR
MAVRITTPVARVLRAFLDDPTQPRYGFELMQRTRLASGTLYPILARLERADWVTRESEDIDPVELGRPARKLYRLTGHGAITARHELIQLNRELQLPAKRTLRQQGT